MFPNAFLDVTASCAVVSVLYPEGPHRTRMEMDFLFSPAALADPSFDPRPIVEFSELVAAQDGAVCELVHRGVGSRRFTHGVPTSKDADVAAFEEHLFSCVDCAARAAEFDALDRGIRAAARAARCRARFRRTR